MTKLLLGLAAAGALALGACGGTQAQQGGQPAAGGAPATVSARQVSGVGTALVDPSGRTLYVADPENASDIRCRAACVRFWVPLTVPAGTTPVVGSGVAGGVTTVDRPDGSVQVIYQGRPLYTFALDQGAGSAKGEGVQDSFDGTDFRWHVARASGAAPSTTPTYSGGGY